MRVGIQQLGDSRSYKFGNRFGHHLTTEKVTPVGTFKNRFCDSVTGMVTKRRNTKEQQVYLREWRKSKGIKGAVLAEALGIEEKSFYRLERETWRLSVTDLRVLAEIISIRPDQFWFHPPTGKNDENISLDHLIENAPKDIKLMAVKAIRGMVEK